VQEGETVIMSNLMETAILKARQLSEHDQDEIAAIILQEIDAEAAWDKLFCRPESAQLLEKLAGEAISEIDAGHARKLDIDEL
jgi:hypothetical protein